MTRHDGRAGAGYYSSTNDRRKLPTQVGVPGTGYTNHRYSASGERFWKSVPGAGAEYYVLGPAATGREQQIGVFTGTTGGTLRHWNILLPSGEAIGRIPATGSRQYYAKDHLGSTRAVVNESGTVVERRDYDAYGMELEGRGLVGSPVMNERYTGHQWDAETGLLYAGARYLDPAIGRFLSVDPLALRYPGYGPYNYVTGNPVTWIDPDGKKVKPVDAAALQAIRSTLSEEDAANVSVGEDGYLVLGEGSGGNFDALSQLVNSEVVIEIAIGDGFTSVGSDGAVSHESFGAIFYDTFDSLYEDLGQGLTKEQFQVRLNDLGIEPGGGNGFFGITLAPNGENDPNGDGRGSGSDAVRIVINGSANERDIARTTAHEAYGHALFYILGKNSSHGNNPELEKQISNRVKEAEVNYESRQN